MNDQPQYNVIDIIRGTTVDGPGFRTAIYLAGCSHCCPECHNPQSHNPFAGHSMTLNEIMRIVKEEDFDVTLTGGDPLYNPFSTRILVEEIWKEGYKIWLYTGFTIEEIKNSEEMSAVLPFLEAIVDGRFDKDLKTTELPFRGSSNQRIIFIKDK